MVQPVTIFLAGIAGVNMSFYLIDLNNPISFVSQKDLKSKETCSFLERVQSSVSSCLSCIAQGV